MRIPKPKAVVHILFTEHSSNLFFIIILYTFLFTILIIVTRQGATASHSLLNNFFIIIARGRKSPGILPFWGDFFFVRRFFFLDIFFLSMESFSFPGGFILFQGDLSFSRGIYPFPGGFILFQGDLSFSREILPFPRRFSLSGGGFRLAGTVLCDTMETSKQRKRGRKRKWISEGSWSARRRRESWG